MIERKPNILFSRHAKRCLVTICFLSGVLLNYFKLFNEIVVLEQVTFLPDSALTAEGKELKDIEEQNEKETSVVKKKVDKMYEEHSWVRKHFNDAEIPLGNDTLATLPTNNELINFVGKNPVFVDTDEGDANQCAMFQQNVPKKNDRWIGIAGMFNSGTNALYRLLKDNCEMPGGNKVYWEVPWGKHGYATKNRKRTAKYFLDNEIEFDIDDGLVVVITRDPYEWSKSMCRNEYLVQWVEWDDNDESVCPNLASPVILWGTHENLLHIWSLWYTKYLHFQYPRVFVRNEDLTLRPRETIEKICHCAGGQMKEAFKHLKGSAKSGGAHIETNIVNIWSKFHWPRDPRGGFSIADYSIAKKTLGEKLMRTFGYTHPQ